MGKIVIPKHSADVDEMNAVLKIHYDANDWVSSSEHNKKLKEIIGPDQYPSSYPKKAQVPAYFGFLESKMTPGKKITERKITESGRRMYKAIIDDDIATRQEILMDALERSIFGRNNAGCASSESDIEAPDLVIRCILDTGFCTSQEYAYMIWNLHDNGKKYYESLPEIIKARSAGGIVLMKEAKDYTDWKPILALIRWGFLLKADDARQKVIIHPDVQKRYSERLNRLKVYNVDKREEIELDKIEDVNSADISVYKPFIISESSAVTIKTGELLEDVINVEKQHIFAGDNVLFVNSTISRLLAYHGYIINDMKKSGTQYRLSLEKKDIVNKNLEKSLLSELREEAKKLEESSATNVVNEILEYRKSDENIKSISSKNKDIEPLNLIIRALADLAYLTESELKFLLCSLVAGSSNYTDAIEQIDDSRRNNNEVEIEECSLNYSIINSLTDSRLLEWSVIDGKRALRFNKSLSKMHLEQFKRLMIYAVDIYKKHSAETEEEPLPLSIKSIFVDYEVDKGELSEIHISKKQKEDVVQGDYIIVVDADFTKICNNIVYQVISIENNAGTIKLKLVKHNYINIDRESEILSDLKEAYYGEC